MLLLGISSRGSGVKSMTVADQDRRARKFGHITRKSSDLGPGLEQTRRVAAADPTVFSQREKRGKVRSAGFRAARLVLFLLPVTVVFVAGCGSPKAASPLPSPEVEVASVVQKDVPIYSEWVATLDGYVNAQIQSQVTGYVIGQTHKEGSFVRKGQILFQIDPRPFQAFLDQANAQLAQAQAQLGKTQMDVDRDTPLAKARAIAQSQLDNDVQANRAAQAAVKAAEAQVEQAKLNLEFTNVKSLLDGISGIAQVQIGNLVNPTTVLTSVSQINPIKAYFSISEQEYIHFADRINAETQKKTPTNGPPFELILADGSVYPHKGVGLLTNRQVDVATGSIQVISSFPNPKNALARAAYFPQIVLSGSGGFQSSALTNLFSGPAGAWSFGASLAQPIFTGGRLRSGVRLAEAQQQTAALFYQQSIQGAFRSVSDALVAYRKTREFRAQQELLFQSAEDAARLSHMRYTGGATGYLEVLTNETNAFSAELGLAQARLNELLALVQLYQALGGGWQQ